MNCKYFLLEFINCIYTLLANSGLVLFTVFKIYSLRCFLVGLIFMTPIKVTRLTFRWPCILINSYNKTNKMH